MKILVIPEDPTYDRHILKPIVERLCSDIDGLTARVEVLSDPHLTGVNEALDQATVRSIIDENPMIDLFLLTVDRDCNRENNSSRAEARCREHQGKLIACLAIEEVETWMLALYRPDVRKMFGVRWSEVRAECDPKERFAEIFLERCGWSAAVGGGRKKAMRPLGTQWSGLLQVCDELAELRDAVARWASTAQG